VLKAKLLLSYLNNMLICWQYGSCIVRSVLFPIRLGIWLQFLVLVMFWLMYFSQNRKNFLSFILDIEKKSSTFLSKAKIKMTILKMNYFVIHYLFQTKNFEMKGIQMCHPNKKFWNEGNSNESIWIPWNLKIPQILKWLIQTHS
jgi:hypothetical protein